MYVLPMSVPVPVRNIPLLISLSIRSGRRGAGVLRFHAFIKILRKKVCFTTNQRVRLERYAAGTGCLLKSMLQNVMKAPFWNIYS